MDGMENISLLPIHTSKDAVAPSLQKTSEATRLVDESCTSIMLTRKQ